MTDFSKKIATTAAVFCLLAAEGAESKFVFPWLFKEDDVGSIDSSHNSAAASKQHEMAESNRNSPDSERILSSYVPIGIPNSDRLFESGDTYMGGGVEFELLPDIVSSDGVKAALYSDMGYKDGRWYETSWRVLETSADKPAVQLFKTRDGLAASFAPGAFSDPNGRILGREGKHFPVKQVALNVDGTRILVVMDHPFRSQLELNHGYISDEPTGEVIFGDFKMDLYSQKIGEGSLGRVFNARKRDDAIAVKVIDTSDASFGTWCELDNEVASMIRLKSCPNVVKLLHYEKRGSIVFLFMELFNKGDLGSLQEQFSTDSGVKTLNDHILHELERGLKDMKEHGVAHFDLKPQHIFLRQEESGDWVVKIGDFGMARMFDKNKMSKYSPLETSEANTYRPGSYSYMPLGALLGLSLFPYLVDRWSFGVISKQLLENRDWSVAFINYKYCVEASIFENNTASKRIAAASMYLTQYSKIYPKLKKDIQKLVHMSNDQLNRIEVAVKTLERLAKHFASPTGLTIMETKRMENNVENLVRTVRIITTYNGSVMRSILRLFSSGNSLYMTPHYRVVHV